MAIFNSELLVYQRVATRDIMEVIYWAYSGTPSEHDFGLQ